MPTDSRYGMNCAMRKRHPAPSSGIGESASTRMGSLTIGGPPPIAISLARPESNQAACSLATTASPRGHNLLA